MSNINVSRRNELHSKSFTLDFYTQELRKYIKFLILSKKIGNIKNILIDPLIKNDKPLALLLGESNRFYTRYPMINSLIEGNKNKKLISSSEIRRDKYYKYLYSYYLDGSIIEKYKGKRYCEIKVRRIIRIYDWLELNQGNLSGLDSFLHNEQIIEKVQDFPISIELDKDNKPHSYAHLDGSHRRCIVFSYGLNKIKTNTVDLKELDYYINSKEIKNYYITVNWPHFVKLIKELDLY